MAVRYVKLVTGEDVIADVTEVEGQAGFTLRNPAKFFISETPSGSSLGMMPFAPFCKGREVVVGAEHIICQMELEDEIYNAYNSKFGSGIIMAKGPMLRGIMPDQE